MQVPGIQQGANNVRGGVAGTSAPFYPTPSFQNHIEQLGKLARSTLPLPWLFKLNSVVLGSNTSAIEQEYDAAADMMDDTGDGPDTPSGPGPFPGPAYTGEPQPMSLSSPVTTGPPGNQPIPGQSPIENAAHTQQSTYPSMTQLLDPNYDFDPFGLSASMAFPTQFSFDTSNMR